MIWVGVQTIATRLASFPETKQGYDDAVSYIETLPDFETGKYYLDAPEWMVQYA